MDEEIKILAQRTVDSVVRKIRKVSKINFPHLRDNVGLGADGTITKYVDKIAEDAAIKQINKSKTKVNILSEEIGYIDNKAEYTFVLDPVDGTRNAYRGIPFFSVSLAVGKERISDIEYGIVKNIPTGDVFTAEKRHGTFYNNKQICVPELPDKELFSSLALGKNYDKVTLKLAKKEKVRSLGAASLEMCMVAIGALDFYVVGREYLRVIDIAASTLIVREAGGVVTNIQGEELDMGFNLDEKTSVLTARNLELVKEIVAI